MQVFLKTKTGRNAIFRKNSLELVNGSDKQYIFIICIGNIGDIANWKTNEEYFRYISILQNTTTVAILSYHPLWYLKNKKKFYSGIQ